jgi:hypothetical protein
VGRGPLSNRHLLFSFSSSYPFFLLPTPPPSPSARPGLAAPPSSVLPPPSVNHCPRPLAPTSTPHLTRNLTLRSHRRRASCTPPAPQNPKFYSSPLHGHTQRVSELMFACSSCRTDSSLLARWLEIPESGPCTLVSVSPCVCHPSIQ